MQINIVDPIFQTYIFLIGFIFFTLATLRKDKDRHEMLHSHTNELKGVAILMVLFIHIGYFLADDHRFLFPLSVDGGVGVNLFLFLSGFGITASMLKKRLNVWQFYKKRLPTIFIPMWVVLTLFVILDFVLLQRTYSPLLLIKNYLGFFPRADIFLDVDSPLWYFTWILFYYLIFPLVFVKKSPSASAVAIVLITTLLLKYKLPVVEDVQKLYSLHTLAFPLGMLFASFLHLKPLGEIKRNFYLLRESHKKAIYFLRYILLGFLAWIIFYTSINSGIGESVKIEQFFSIVTTLALVLFFYLKRYKSEFIALLGVYSYEIYLIQWPLMYRYDFVYKYFPAGIATLIYLILLIVLGMGLNRLTKKISHFFLRT